MVVRYNTFGSFLKRTFGTVVYKVNVDAGFTCPNRDGTLGVTGCTYCNNDSFRPSQCRPQQSLREQIRNGIQYLSGRYRAQKFLVYFQPFTNTYAPVEVLEPLYREALSTPDVVGLAIGTRPDCIDEEKIAMIGGFAKDHFMLMEYGLQSVYDKSLEYIRRGHNYASFLDAVNLTVGRGIHIGAHIIVGFPTETRDETLAMADELSGLPVGFLKIHQLQIVRETPLAEEYIRSPFHTFGYGEYLDFLVDFIVRLSPDIVLQRLFATAPDEILIAPQWGKNRQEIINDIQRRFVQRDAVQGSQCICHRH